MATSKTKRAPRTAPEVRREQLVAAATTQFAAHGYNGAQLQAIADEVGVTRNLIHRYFPGGKHDLYVEAVRSACLELADVLDVDPDVPLAEKTVANITRYVDAILEAGPTYVLYSRARRSADDDISVFATAMRDTVVSRIALNNLGTPDPPAFARAVLDGFAAFVEETCASWRDRGLSDRQELEQLLGSVFASVITAARAA